MRPPQPPLTVDELAAIDCAIRSDIAPSVETARRMLADLRGYRDALLFDQARRELGEPAGGGR